MSPLQSDSNGSCVANIACPAASCAPFSLFLRQDIIAQMLTKGIWLAATGFTHKQGQMAVMVTKAIFMCRDLLKNSNRDQQQQLYPELTQALAAAQSSTQALPYLEVKAAFGHCTNVQTGSSSA